jgi:hypothetical protein
MLHVHVKVHVHIYLNARLSGIRSVWYRTKKKLTMPEEVRYPKLTQCDIFLVRYRTKIRNAGMPMLALVFSMPMLS